MSMIIRSASLHERFRSSGQWRDRASAARKLEGDTWKGQSKTKFCFLARTYKVCYFDTPIWSINPFSDYYLNSLNYRHFSWQWDALVTATAVTSSCIHIFPYHNDSQALKIVALIVFLIGLVFFVFNTGCKIAKAMMYPKVRLLRKQAVCSSRIDEVDT